MVRHSRRDLISMLFGVAGHELCGQGITTRRASTDRNAKRIDIPFHTHFLEVGAKAGLQEAIVYGGVNERQYILEAIGCGCAFIDYDNDGWMDLFILSGTSFDERATSATNRLYHNNRDGTFTDVTVEAGLHRTGWFCGVCVGDIDNDGYEDLFVTSWGENLLYRNNGNGTFTDITQDALPPQKEKRWGTGCTFLDYDRDGNLDLFVANYLKFDQSTAPLPGSAANCRFVGLPVNCGPRGFPYGQHSLLRNDGKGVFTDVSKEAGIASSRSSYGLTAVAADFNNDGWPDLFVACDSTPSLLFLNNHDGTFREEGILRGVAFSGDGQEQAGMGVAVRDVNNDGHLDILKTHFADDLPILYQGGQGGVFDEVTRAAGLGVDNRFVCWGVGLEDLDNDGNVDIFITTGHVYPELERRFSNYPAKSPPLLFQGISGGRFQQLSSADHAMPEMRHSSRGCAFGDFDNDGDVDILMVNLNEPPSLLRNDAEGSQHWIKVFLIGRQSNRSAIGARVTVITPAGRQMQERQSQSSFLSSNDPRLHFGLGLATEAEVQVRWPNGHVQRLGKQKADRLITLDEAAGVVGNRGWRASTTRAVGKEGPGAA